MTITFTETHDLVREHPYTLHSVVSGVGHGLVFRALFKSFSGGFVHGCVYRWTCSMMRKRFSQEEMSNVQAAALVAGTSTASAVIANQITKFVSKNFFKSLPKTLGGLSLWYSFGLVGAFGLLSPLKLTQETKYTRDLTDEEKRQFERSPS